MGPVAVIVEYEVLLLNCYIFTCFGVEEIHGMLPLFQERAIVGSVSYGTSGDTLCERYVLFSTASACREVMIVILQLVEMGVELGQ